MAWKQLSLESFLDKGEGANKETPVGSQKDSKRTYLNYNFMATNDSQGPRPLCVPYGEWQSS